MTDLRYPIGKYERVTEPLAEAERRRLIDDIAGVPAAMREAVKGLSKEQLDTPYRPEGWTVRQVVHHLPDSHINCYVRFKLALTENEPLIKTYEEQLWAELPDGKSAEIEVSLSLLEAVHRRWVLTLRSMTPADFARKFKHPELGVVSLDQALGSYAWHGRHHIAHITALRERMGWK